MIVYTLMFNGLINGLIWFYKSTGSAEDIIMSDTCTRVRCAAKTSFLCMKLVFDGHVLY